MMKISEYIQLLQAMQAEHGDLQVDCYGNRGRTEAGPPEIAYRKVLSKRESRPDFWNDWYTGDQGKKGEKVCRL
jgi:hypothetical protein